MSKDTFERVRSLLKSYKGESDKKFAADYRSVVSEGSRSGQLSEEQIVALDRVRATVEEWHRHAEAEGTSPIEQWRQLAEATKGHVPAQLLATVLSRVPRGRLKAVDWSHLVLADADRSLLALLTKEKLLKSSDLVRIAKARPTDFYFSPGLDVLLDAAACPPRTVWKAVDQSPERAAGLLPGPEALAEAYGLDTSADASSWFVAFLASNDHTRPSVVRQVLRDPSASERLARYLSVAGSGMTGKKRATAVNAATAVIEDFLEACAEAIEAEKRTQETAAWGLAMLTLGAHAPTRTVPATSAKSIDRIAGRIARQRILSLLRTADVREDRNEAALATRESDLYEAVQEYLRNLPGGGDENAPAERAVRYQRYAGMKEVIQELLPLLQEAADAPINRASLDAALFNVGLRPLGVSEGHASFDSRKHAPTVAGIVPGDPVRIVRPGWQLGDDDDATVLEKAQVTVDAKPATRE